MTGGVDLCAELPVQDARPRAGRGEADGACREVGRRGQRANGQRHGVAVDRQPGDQAGERGEQLCARRGSGGDAAQLRARVVQQVRERVGDKRAVGLRDADGLQQCGEDRGRAARGDGGEFACSAH